MARKKSKEITPEDYDQIKRVSRLLDRDEYETAHKLLEKLESKYPTSDEILLQRAFYFSYLGSVHQAWWYTYSALKANTDNMQALTAHITNCVELGYLWTTLYYLDAYRELSVIMPPKLVELNEQFVELAEKQRQTKPEFQGKALTDLILLDIASAFIDLHKLDDAEKVLKQASKKLSDVPEYWHILQLLLMCQGKLDQAIETTRETIKQFPSDLMSMYTLCEFCYLAGDEAALEQAFQQAQANPPVKHYEITKCIEMLALLDKPDDIVTIYKSKFEGKKEETPRVNTLHLIATSFALTGDTETARTMWREMQEEGPYIITENLSELQKPSYLKNGIVYFELDFLMPPAWMNLVTEPFRSGKQLEQRIKKLFKKEPYLENIVNILFERGDWEGRDFALYLCKYHPVPMLYDFATGTRGYDAHRLRALWLWIDHGKLEGDELPDMWMNGKWQKPHLFEFQINTEADPDDVPKHFQKMLEKIYDRVSSSKPFEALDLIEEAGEIDPDNRVLMNYEHMVYRMLEDDESADYTLNEMVEKHPDYLFTRAEMARSLIRENKLDEAEEWIKPLYSKTEFHISEFRIYAVTRIEWFIAKEMYDDAINWLNQLQAIAPELIDAVSNYLTNITTRTLMSNLFDSI